MDGETVGEGVEAVMVKGLDGETVFRYYGNVLAPCPCTCYGSNRTFDDILKSIDIKLIFLFGC